MPAVDIFGKLVNKNFKKHPRFTRGLINTGYTIQSYLLKHKPNANFLPSQILLTRASMKYILMPLKRPGRAALVNLFTPCEILHAMDIYPLCAEGYSSYLTGGKCENGFIDESALAGAPDTLCSYHRAMTGAAFSGVMAKPKYIITTSSVCDANINSFRRIAEMFSMNEFFIDVPAGESEDAVRYVERQIKRLVEFLEDGEKRKLDGGRFDAAVKNSNQSLRYYLDFIKELETRYFPSSITLEMFRIFATHILLGTPEAKEYFRLQLSEIKNFKKSDSVRILWSHVLPYYSGSLQNWLDFNPGCQLLLSDMNYDIFEFLSEENPFRSMAKRLILNHFNSKGERKIKNNIAMAKRLKADAAVIFCHWGCKQSNGSAYMLKEAFRENGVPALVLDGDACDRRNSAEEQLKTRLEAFIEMLEAGK